MSIALFFILSLGGCEFSGKVDPNIECTNTCDEDSQTCYETCETECADAGGDTDEACDTDCKTVCDDEADSCTLSCTEAE